jgi:flagellar biosynthesis protein FlhB
VVEGTVAASTSGLSALLGTVLKFAWVSTSPNALAVPDSGLVAALELGAAVLFVLTVVGLFGVLLAALFRTELMDMTRLRWDFDKISMIRACQ